MQPFMMLKAIDALETALASIELFCEYGTMDRPIERRDELQKTLKFLKDNFPVDCTENPLMSTQDVYYYK